MNVGISKYLRISNKQLSFGIQGAYVQKALNGDELTFGDDIDQQLGFISSDPNIGTGISAVSPFNLAAGAVFQGKWGNIGIAAHNITQPNESFVGTSSRLPLRYSAHGAYQIQIKKVEFAATAVYLYEQDSNHLYSFLTAKYMIFKIMGGYAFNDAILMGGGLQLRQVGVNY